MLKPSPTDLESQKAFLQSEDAWEVAKLGRADILTAALLVAKCGPAEYDRGFAAWQIFAETLEALDHGVLSVLGGEWVSAPTEDLLKDPGLLDKHLDLYEYVRWAESHGYPIVEPLRSYVSQAQALKRKPLPLRQQQVYDLIVKNWKKTGKPITSPAIAAMRPTSDSTFSADLVRSQAKKLKDKGLISNNPGPGGGYFPL